jgi:hypothetical protein
MNVVDYGESVNITCKACSEPVYDDAENICGNSTTSTITRGQRFAFMLYPVDEPPYFPNIPYEFGIIGDINELTGLNFTNAFIDCNGDLLYDYLFDNSTSWANYYVKGKGFDNVFYCQFPSTLTTEHHVKYMTAGVTVTKDSGIEWPGLFSSCKGLSGDVCVLIKKYPVFIE